MKKRNHSLKLRLEGLENRQLLTISLSSAGVLSVIGTNSEDHISVTPTKMAFTGGPGIKATRTDAAGNILETESFKSKSVTSLYISAKSGIDVITNDTALPSTIYGGSAPDIVRGGSGRDVIYGGSYSDSLFGGGGNDYLSGEGGADVLFGEAGNDQLRGNAAADVLLGGSGHDDLRGSTGADWMLGGSDDDYLVGGNGKDFLFGDTPSIATMTTLAEHMGAGMPTFASDDVIKDGGIAGNDILYGSDDSDVLFGQGGADWLYGDNGEDFLFGGTGCDLLAGGAGSDTMDPPDIIPVSLVYAQQEENTYIFQWEDHWVLHGDGWWAEYDTTFGGPPPFDITIDDGVYEGHMRRVFTTSPPGYDPRW